jgi:hypothetical protein
VSVKIHPVLIVAIIVGGLFIWFMACRGYNNGKALAESNYVKDSSLEVIKQLKAKGVEDSIDHETKLAVKDGEYDLLNNRSEAERDSLKTANDRITHLLHKHVPIKPSSDTNVTVVPNLYIKECSQCFHELSSGQQLVKKFITTSDSIKSVLISKEKIYDGRIKQLENEKKGAYDIAELAEKEFEKKIKALQPRRTVYLSLGTMAWDGYLPKSVGIGGIYQDKMRRQFGGMIYGSNIGIIYQANIAVPLSLRRNK